MLIRLQPGVVQLGSRSYAVAQVWWFPPRDHTSYIMRSTSKRTNLPWWDTTIIITEQNAITHDNHMLPTFNHWLCHMKWRVDVSSDSSSDSSESMDETLTPEQLDYVKIGDTFLKLSKLQGWFDRWKGQFNYMSDCFFVAFKGHCHCLRCLSFLFKG